MINKIRSLSKTRFRKTNFKAFIFFLIFAVVIWVFAQFSKDYIQILQVPLKFVNVPPDKFITDENPEFLKLRMHNTGFKIAYFSLFTPTLTIDISETEEVNENLVYSIDENLRDIERQLDIDFGKSGFLTERLIIHFQQRKEKTIPVFPRIEVEFAVGYAAVEKVFLEPDSITVSGPDNILDTLNQLVTVPLTLKEVKDDLLGKIAVDTSNLKKITVYQNKVQYSLKVEKFTEGRVVIPVDLINVPRNLNVVIFPKEVVLFYKVNLTDFKKVSAADFRVVCDFKEKGTTENFLIPKISKQPPMVTNLRLNEKKIQFIIKK